MGGKRGRLCKRGEWEVRDCIGGTDDFCGLGSAFVGVCD